MRNLARGFTMRKDGVLPRGDWFSIKNEASEKPSIYIYDEIGFWGTEAGEFVEQLIKLDADEIDLHLNSPGGEVFDGLAIYNSLKQHKAKINVYVDGLAASAASFIAQAGDSIIMARNAQMMIHDGIAICYGNEQDMLETADLLGKISNNIADIYAQRAGEDQDYWRNLMREELWMTGREAVDMGLADSVLDEDSEEADKAKNKWDLGFFNYAGRERAESPTRVAARLMVSNNSKEKQMSQGATEPSEGGGSQTQPAEQPTQEEQANEVEGQQTDGPDTDSGTPETQPTAPPQAPATSPVMPENSAQGVMINGKLETDWSVINRHFAAMQTAQAEQQATFRRSFIEKLATENKIAATQIDSLVSLVNGDSENNVPAMSGEQFAAFQASYESVAPSTLFSQHATQDPAHPGVQPSAGSPLPNSPEAVKDRIDVLQGIVSMHQRTMPEDEVKNTPSYKELQQLLGQTNKS